MRHQRLLQPGLVVDAVGADLLPPADRLIAAPKQAPARRAGSHDTQQARQQAADRMRERARLQAERLRPQVQALIATTRVTGPAALARGLNRAGVRAARGGCWNGETAARLAKRLGITLGCDVAEQRLAA